MNTADLTEAGQLPALAPLRAGGFPSFSAASMGARVTAVLLLFAICWLGVLDVTSLVPPVDNIEQLVWLRSLAWGYYKHPPLPTVVAWVAAGLFGASAWTTYVLGAATTMGAMAVFWRLLRDLRGARYATIALLAALCITFYNGRLYYYNHNIVLLLLATAAAALCWRAFDERRLRWWVALGVVMGLGALTKYQVAVTVVSLASFFAWRRAWRDPVHRLGALLATLVALIMFVPHVLWLRGHQFGPITYAIETSLGVDLSPAARTLGALNWLADELLNRAFPALLLLGLALFSARRLSAFSRADDRIVDQARLRSSRALLVCWGVVPLIFMPLVALVFGADLQLQWGTSFLLFIVPCVMELRAPARWNQVSQRFVWKVFFAIQALLVAISIATSPVGMRSLVDTHWRTFSAAQLATRVAADARVRLHGRVAVIIGPVGEAGALSLQLPERPAVLVDGRYDRSPWISRELVAACGAIELVHSTQALLGLTRVGAPFHDLYWRVVPPAPHAGRCEIPRAR